MAYSINLTDGTLLVTIPNNTVLPAGPSGGTLDLTLYGKGKLDYGEAWNENFVHLLENFANTTAPLFPIEGQLWFDQSSTELKLRVGTGWATLITSGAGASTFVNISGDSMTGDLDMSGNDILNVGNLAVGTINGFNISTHAARHQLGGGDQINHDLLLNFVGNEHINHSGVNINPGIGLAGGGDITTSRTLDLAIPVLPIDASPSSTDFIITYNSVNGHQRATLSSVISSGITKASAGPLVISNVVTWNHNLGVEPDLVTVIMECVIAEYGYSVGDRIMISDGIYSRQTQADVNETVGIEILLTTVNQLSVNAATRIAVPTKGVGGDTLNFITRANWRFYFKAMVL